MIELRKVLSSLTAGALLSVVNVEFQWWAAPGILLIVLASGQLFEFVTALARAVKEGKKFSWRWELFLKVLVWMMWGATLGLDLVIQSLPDIFLRPTDELPIIRGAYICSISFAIIAVTAEMVEFGRNVQFLRGKNDVPSTAFLAGVEMVKAVNRFRLGASSKNGESDRWEDGLTSERATDLIKYAQGLIGPPEWLQELSPVSLPEDGGTLLKTKPPEP